MTVPPGPGPAPHPGPGPVVPAPPYRSGPGVPPYYGPPPQYGPVPQYGPAPHYGPPQYGPPPPRSPRRRRALWVALGLVVGLVAALVAVVAIAAASVGGLDRLADDPDALTVGKAGDCLTSGSSGPPVVVACSDPMAAERVIATIVATRAEYEADAGLTLCPAPMTVSEVFVGRTAGSGSVLCLVPSAAT